MRAVCPTCTPTGGWYSMGLRDGTYALDDLQDLVELIRVRRKNEKRAADAAHA